MPYCSIPKLGVLESLALVPFPLFSLPILADAEGQPFVTGALSLASSDTLSLVGSDVVASALAQAMAQQLAVSASDIEVAVTATSDGSGMGVAYAIEAESAASAAVILSHIAAMDLAVFDAAVLSELEAAGLADAAIDNVSGIQPRLSYCPPMLMLKASPSVTCVISLPSSDTASIVGRDMVASDLAQAMSQQLGASASDIKMAVTATFDGSGVGAAYAVQVESAASASVISSQIAAMDLAALLEAMLPELEAASPADVAIDDVFDVSAEAAVLPMHAVAECQLSVIGESPDDFN